MTTQTAESFWARVDKSGDCWLWTGSTNNSGYGTVAWDGSYYVAHRIAAWLEGMISTPRAPRRRSDPGHVLHECDNRICCRKKHFFLGSYGDNMLDMYRKERHIVYRGETHTNAAFTNLEVEAIRRQYRSVGSFTALARQHGVCETTISNIIKRRTYVG